MGKALEQMLWEGQRTSHHIGSRSSESNWGDKACLQLAAKIQDSKGYR